MNALNHAKTALLLGAMLGLCMVVGHFIGGPRGVMMGLMFGGIGNLLAFFFSDRIALASMGAQPLARADQPWFHDMIADLSQRAGLPMPRVYVFQSEAPNAFATGRNPRNSAVAISEGMLRTFPRPEIEAVMAHELGHVKHRDVLISTLAAVMAGIISYAGYMLMFFGGGRDDRREGNPLAAVGALASIILAPIAAMLIQMAISRSREYAADHFAGQLVGNPMNLASALARLSSKNEQIPTEANPAFNSLFIIAPLSSGSSFATWFSTHPPIEQRIDALRQQAAGVR